MKNLQIVTFYVIIFSIFRLKERDKNKIRIHLVTRCHSSGDTAHSSGDTVSFIVSNVGHIFRGYETRNFEFSFKERQNSKHNIRFLSFIFPKKIKHIALFYIYLILY